jgi:hypothetical protein
MEPLLPTLILGALLALSPSVALAAESPRSLALDPAVDAAVAARTGPPIWLSASANPPAIAKLTRILGTVRISVCGRAVEHYAAIARMKRSPKMTANWALAMDHSRGGIFHSFSDRFKIR